MPLLTPESIDERVEHFQARATKEGKKAQDLAKEVLTEAGFEIIDEKVKVKGTGLQLNFLVTDQAGEYSYYVDMSGAFTSSRPGLMRTDTLWKMLGRAHVLKTARPDTPVILMTAHGSEDLAAAALREGAVSYLPKRNLVHDLTYIVDRVSTATGSVRVVRPVSSNARMNSFQAIRNVKIPATA